MCASGEDGVGAVLKGNGVGGTADSAMNKTVVGDARRGRNVAREIVNREENLG